MAAPVTNGAPLSLTNGAAYVDDMWPEDDDLIALPPGPLCALCYHEACPCCPLPFCDRLEDGCCELQCAIDGADFAAWKAECDERVSEALIELGFEPDETDKITFVRSLGPWCPVAIRQARGIHGP